MTRAELLALAERVEAAAGPDRELDGLIYMAIRSTTQRLPPSWKVLPDTGQIYAWNRPPPHAPGSGGVWAQSPRYTASIDAAASLVPDGEGFALVYNAAKVDIWTGKGKTPALALLAAALFARAEEAAWNESGDSARAEEAGE